MSRRVSARKLNTITEPSEGGGGLARVSPSNSLKCYPLPQFWSLAVEPEVVIHVSGKKLLSRDAALQYSTL